VGYDKLLFHERYDSSVLSLSTPTRTAHDTQHDPKTPVSSPAPQVVLVLASVPEPTSSRGSLESLLVSLTEKSYGMPDVPYSRQYVAATAESDGSTHPILKSAIRHYPETQL
jgi:hypothetical protein